MAALLLQYIWKGRRKGRESWKGAEEISDPHPQEEEGEGKLQQDICPLHQRRQEDEEDDMGGQIQRGKGRGKRASSFILFLSIHPSPPIDMREIGWREKRKEEFGRPAPRTDGPPKREERKKSNNLCKLLVGPPSEISSHLSAAFPSLPPLNPVNSLQKGPPPPPLFLLLRGGNMGPSPSVLFSKGERER